MYQVLIYAECPYTGREDKTEFSSKYIWTENDCRLLCADGGLVYISHINTLN